MKIKRLRTIIALALAATALACSGCATPIEKRSKQLSELRDELMLAKSDRATVSLCSGVREKPFEIDGESGAKTEFTVVTATINAVADGAEVTYSLSTDGSTYEGTLEKHPFKGSYSVELDERLRNAASLTLKSGSYEENFELKSVLTGEEITADEALTIAEKRLKTRVEKMTTDGKLNAELYVRFIENPISSAGGYYWYVAFCPEKYTVYAVLVDPLTREIIAVRE